MEGLYKKVVRGKIINIKGLYPKIPGNYT
jgi:hypothetical protein